MFSQVHNGSGVSASAAARSDHQRASTRGGCALGNELQSVGNRYSSDWLHDTRDVVRAVQAGLKEGTHGAPCAQSGPLWRIESKAGMFCAGLHALGGWHRAAPERPPLITREPRDVAAVMERRLPEHDATPMGVAAFDYAPLSAQGQGRAASRLSRVSNAVNALTLSGVYGAIRRHPLATVVTATGLIAGAAVATLRSVAGLWHSEGSGDQRFTGLIEQMRLLSTTDGQSLDMAVAQAVHACAGNHTCARETVLALLNDLPEESRSALTHDRQVDIEPGFLPLASASPLVASPLDSLVDLIVRTYEHWDEQRFGDGVQAIAQAADNHDRRRVIEQSLDDLGISFCSYPFPGVDSSGAMAQGQNVVADLPSSSTSTALPTILLGAHFDKIGAGSSGAMDNASGCVALLQLAQRLRDEPLPNCHVKLAFFDQEEVGLMGSKAFVEACQIQEDCPSLLINVDMLGTGDIVFAGSSNASHLHMLDNEPMASRTVRPEQPAETAFLDLLREEGLASGQPVMQGQACKQSDNLPFQHAGLPAIGLAHLSRGDISAFERLVASKQKFESSAARVDWNRLMPLFSEADAGNQTVIDEILGDPAYVAFLEAHDENEGAMAGLSGTVFTRIHSERDQADQLDLSRASVMVSMLENALRKYAQRFGLVRS